MARYLTKLYLMLSVVLILGVFLIISVLRNSTLPLRVGINQWPGYETLYLARSLGYTDQSAIKLVDLPSATEVMHAMQNKTLELATLTLDESLSLLAAGIKIKIVAVMDISAGADALLARPAYASIEDLKGKRIGVETTAVGAILLNCALDQVALSVSDFTLVPMTVNQHTRAYKNKKIEAVVTFEPVKSQLLSLGANSLFDSRMIPGRIVDVLAVREDVLEHRTESVCDLVNAQFKALAYFQKYPEQAVQLMAPRLPMKPDMLLESYQGLTLPNHIENKQLFSDTDQGLKNSVLHLARLMQRQRLLNQIPDVVGLVDNRCIRGDYFD